MLGFQVPYTIQIIVFGTSNPITWVLDPYGLVAIRGGLLLKATVTRTRTLDAEALDMSSSTKRNLLALLVLPCSA